MEYQIILKEYEGNVPVREEVWELDGNRRSRERRSQFSGTDWLPENRK